MRTLQHVPTRQPARLTLDIGAAAVTVHTEDRPDITVTLAPATSTDTTATGLIERASASVIGDEFQVIVPRPDGTGTGQTTVVRSRDGSVRISSSTIGRGDVVIGDLNGVTVVNGRVISGPGVTVVGGNNGAVRAEIRVPAETHLTVRTDHANLTAYSSTGTPLGTVDYRSINGNLAVDTAVQLVAETISGDIDTDIVAFVHARTTRGDVRCRAVKGATISTISGDVRIDEAHGPVRASATRGDISVHAVTDTQVSAQTISGDIRVTHNPGVQVAAQLDTVRGRVRGPEAAR